MAVRLHMKLGVVAEPDRLPDSPDTVVVVEPSVGSVARSKGNLYLLVTANGTSNRIHDATRLAAETIRNEYYYDKSAGIRGCLAKAIGLANKRLAHLRDRLGMHERDIAGPIGIGLAVVRGSELYVATVGPAEAYLIRQARLSTLPDPHRERGLPSRELEPDVWRGEISVGDSLVIVSANVMSRIGPDELKDAMVTLHPQSAMEHLHHRFITNGGSGNDGAIAIEATEVAATQKSRSLVPVRPAEPLAGTPERSPIPLADSVTDGVAAVQAGAHQARVAAGGVFERGIRRLLDLLPERNTAYRRVTPLASRREAQRRAAVALLAFVLVVGGLGVGVFLAASGTPRAPLRSVSAAQAALDLARADIAKVWGPGVDLVVRDREEAERLLTEAYAELDKAEDAGISTVTVAGLRSRVVAGLDQLYGVVDVDPAVLFSFETADPPVDLAALVKGPDDAAYVLDRASKAVFRVDFNAAAAANIMRPGQKASGTTVSEPQLLGAGGPDLLVLDSENVLWRWRPANRAGRGTIARIQVTGAASWGADVPAFGTYLRNPRHGPLQPLRRQPGRGADPRSPAERGRQWLPGRHELVQGASAADGSHFPVHRRRYLPRRRRGGHAVQQWQPERLGARSSGRRAAATRAQLQPHGVVLGQADRQAVRLRPAKFARHRHRQGHRRVHRAVPPDRRCDHVDRRAGHVRRPRCR